MINLPESFRNYLKTQKVSLATVKNYVADINHFLKWFRNHHQVTGQNILRFFTDKTLVQYKKHLLTKNSPLSTINRRFSALRKFGQFAQSKGWLKKNPAIRTQSIEPKIIVKFKKHLEKEKISPITIKNYLSDLRHFLAWLKAS